jgi:hypothetical protein
VTHHLHGLEHVLFCTNHSPQRIGKISEENKCQGRVRITIGGWQLSYSVY